MQFGGTQQAKMAPAGDNPANLKLMLALYGVAAVRPLGSVLELLIDGHVPARARVNPESSLKLVESDGRATIEQADSSTGVRVLPEPAFAERRNGRGIRLGDLVQIQGGYAVVKLGGGCGLGTPGRACAFCMGRELTEKAGELWPVEEIVEAVGAAFEHGEAEFVHFRVGYFPGDDAGVQILIPYLQAIHHHFDTFVAVTMHPPATQRAIDLSYASGVDILACNLEAADEESMRNFIPGRARFFGRQRYLDALGHAARIFPAGAVWSEILIDLAAPSATASTMDQLVAMGVVPLLGASASAAERPALPQPELLGLPPRSFSAVLKAGINMTWARDLSSVITPLEGRYFIPDAPQLPALMHQLARNRLGALTARSLARMRRRLRVRRVRASFESSRL